MDENKMKQKMLLVGGHPKGFDVPFHPKTLSGKRLRKIVESNNLDVEYLDIFKNDEAERLGLIEEEAYYKLFEFRDKGLPIVTLGRWVFECVFQTGVPCIYLPHPA